ncbi:PP2C family serine/threonine-protein phosphatase [Endozoicomonas atrinae]|uniref:PP2C family serine/threonine-protein phosphatase n=1 Tax=Endozoicomonas atrinae TaxID=1333660 RepID=UPI003B003920
MPLTIDIAAASNLFTAERAGSATKKRRTSDENTPPAIQKGVSSAEANPFHFCRGNNHSPRGMHPLSSTSLAVLSNPENRMGDQTKDEHEKLKRAQTEFFVKRAGSSEPAVIEQWIESALAQNMTKNNERNVWIRGDSGLTQQTSSVNMGNFLYDPFIKVTSANAQYKSAKDEDTLFSGSIELVVGGKLTPFFYSIVCDGHGGQNVSRQIQSEFPAVLFDAIQRSCHGQVSTSSIYYALSLAFENIQQRVDENIKKIPQGKLNKGMGSTVSLMLQTGQYAWFANLGDTRSIVMPNDKGIVLQATEDSRCSNPEHQQKIVQQGGFVKNNKVNGVLSVTSAIGIYFFPPNRDAETLEISSLINPEPRITRVDIDRFPWVVQASDGLWDMVSNSEVRDLALQYGTPDELARMLLNTAQSNWDAALSRFPPGKRRAVDDISVSVTQFSKARMEIA